jgi:aminoglycoside phosphotransferase family enzyme/predicted kinase
LYLSVVPIVVESGQRVVDGDGPIVDYAVQMRRFTDESLFSRQLEAGNIAFPDIVEIASCVSQFHQHARVLQGPFDRWLDTTQQLADDNLDALADASHPELRNDIEALRLWTHAEWDRRLDTLRSRCESGFVRECHGDLHCNNLVQWRGHWVPFDGIEFNPDLSWIDVINDAAFLMMDLQARGHSDLATLWINAYLEGTGDYEGLKILRWYLAYRALVRAKVAAMREHQVEDAPQAMQSVSKDVDHYVALACGFTCSPAPLELRITHGFSGSGKSTRAMEWADSIGAIRIRSDIERLRIFGSGHYDSHATRATYERLATLAECILDSGYSVVIDAAFLKRDQRTRFRELAASRGIDFRILDCQADLATLRQRIAERRHQGIDPSEADASVLEIQIQSHEPLDVDEAQYVVRQGSV